MTSTSQNRRGNNPNVGIKAAVKTVALSNITLFGLQTLDGYTTIAGDRVLLINQTDATENGIYVASASAWERSTDWNDDYDVINGTLVISTHRGGGFTTKFDGDFIIGTTEPTFELIFGHIGVANQAKAYLDMGFSITYVSSTQFQVNSLDVSNLFYVGRRLLLVTADGQEYYGNISASAYVTDTTVTMTMDDSVSIPTNLTHAVFTTSDTQWAPIPANNHNFPAMNNPRICVGKIGVNVWWVLVGNGGYLATSNNAGLTWNQRVITGGLTTERIYDVGFDSASGLFICGAESGYIIKSTDGVNWVSSIATDITAAVTTGDGSIGGMQYNDFRGQWWAMFSQTSAYDQLAYSSDGGSTWSISTTSLNSRGSRYRYNPYAYYMFTVASNGSTLSMSTATGGWTVEDSSGLANDITFRSLGNYALICSNDGDVRRGATGGTGTWADIATTQFDPDIPHCIADNYILSRLVVAGTSGKLMYTDDLGTTWTTVATGCNPTATILAMEYSYDDSIFVAVTNDGYILRSSNGT